MAKRWILQVMELAWGGSVTTVATCLFTSKTDKNQEVSNQCFHFIENSIVLNHKPCIHSWTGKTYGQNMAAKPCDDRRGMPAIIPEVQHEVVNYGNKWPTSAPERGTQSSQHCSFEQTLLTSASTIFTYCSLVCSTTSVFASINWDKNSKVTFNRH